MGHRHRSSAQESPPFWFAGRVDGGEAPWRAFIQLNGRVDNLATGFLTEADCLDYIHGEILKAGSPDAKLEALTDMELLVMSEQRLFDLAGYACFSGVHFVYCRGCKRAWLDPPPAPLCDCACTCSDPADLLYEAWAVDPLPEDFWTPAQKDLFRQRWGMPVRTPGPSTRGPGWSFNPRESP